MNIAYTRITIRLTSVALALVCTLATMSAIDTLATVEPAAAQMAQAHGAQA